MAGDRGLLRSICPRQAQLTHPPPILALGLLLTLNKLE
jgi:hypothetical protein